MTEATVQSRGKYLDQSGDLFRDGTFDLHAILRQLLGFLPEDPARVKVAP